ncbi:hypothetical protein A1O7_09513 [Cladophialophora yegresii CBS 114405]|uniref:Ribosomal RNA-processing protein 42 n=1 Tax=Cladophialophora yegresii CBS 114405 TaxID=1182544 RepID=W9VPV8_9EURO|nr:uncharacterized protein A1O7_09513 [Cladophialophora yegresii CBS 114405]EXJ54176.1 hypothetical protein A1O7_09513 [Cladophialophora yegresii CBS 114405]
MPSSLTSSLPFSPAELAYLHTSLSSTPPIRPDARPSPTDFRALRAETGVLPSVNGSAHVGFSDGREAIVGVKLEVERTFSVEVRASTSTSTSAGLQAKSIMKAKGGDKTRGEGGAGAGAGNDGEATDVDVDVDMNPNDSPRGQKGRGSHEWVTLSLTLPGLRDDDAGLVFLEEMLREPLVVASSSSRASLQDSLVINSRWHWHVYIDVLLISATGLASYPLPLLSMATHLALRDTRVPRLKSEGEEDPVADDDWMASAYLYSRTGTETGIPVASRPPVTLLVVVVGENVIFDPSREELAVADAVVAVSVGVASGGEGGRGARGAEFEVLATRMIDTPARDTMKGVPLLGEVGEGVEVPGIWKPRVGGIKRSMLKKAVNTALTGGVARDVMDGLDGFLDLETKAAVGAGAG